MDTVSTVGLGGGGTVVGLALDPETYVYISTASRPVENWCP